MEGWREEGRMHGMKRLISLAVNVLPKVGSHDFQCMISRGQEVTLTLLISNFWELII